MAGPVPGHIPAPPQRGGSGSRVLVKVVWSAVPFLTIGLLGFLPSLYLAVRHRTVRDWIGLACFLAASVGEWTVAWSLPDDGVATSRAQDLAMLFFLMAGTLGAMVHFLVMDRPVAAAAAQPPPYQPYYAQGGPYVATQQYAATQQYPATLPYAPQPYAAPPAAGPVAHRDAGQADQVKAELEELSELLKRQGQDQGRD
jgi:hypothetical protein